MFYIFLKQILVLHTTQTQDFFFLFFGWHRSCVPLNNIIFTAAQQVVPLLLCNKKVMSSNPNLYLSLGACDLWDVENVEVMVEFNKQNGVNVINWYLSRRMNGIVDRKEKALEHFHPKNLTLLKFQKFKISDDKTRKAGYQFQKLCRKNVKFWSWKFVRKKKSEMRTFLSFIEQVHRLGNCFPLLFFPEN